MGHWFIFEQEIVSVVHSETDLRLHAIVEIQFLSNEISSRSYTYYPFAYVWSGSEETSHF